MAKTNDTVGKTIFIVVALCFVCSVIVSSVAVLLKPKQQENIKLDKQIFILEAAGFDNNTSDGKPYVRLLSKQEIQQTYAKYISPRIVDLTTGLYVDSLNPESYNQAKAARNIETAIIPKNDIAKVKQIAKDELVYLVRNDQGQYENVILPIHGAGLWSTMYAFVALEPDLNTVKSLVYYQQGETPGLGGEVQNPNWQKLWQGKKVYDKAGQVALHVTKIPSETKTPYGVDALSGATLTSNGVTNSFVFWFGDQGFKPYLTVLKKEGLH